MLVLLPRFFYHTDFNCYLSTNLILIVMITEHDYCVIMCGGVGRRFWPFSRKEKPKQFLDFLGIGRSLLQLTYDRFAKIIPKDRIFISTNEAYVQLIHEQLPGVDDRMILAEPTKRNTAPCIAWASYHIRSLDPEANIVVTPSDHLILREADFLDVIGKCFDFVRKEDILLTIGIKPNRPETGYGYIQVGDLKEDGLYEAKTFTEKPELDMAKVFIETGEFYWNSGIFVWNVNSIISAFEQLQPLLCASLKHGEMIGSWEEKDFIKQNYSYCPNVSIDYGIMEKAGNVCVTLADFGWADLGTWDSLYDASPKDHEGNVILQCGTLLYNSKNNIIALPKDKIAVIQNMDGYLIAESGNVLIICKKDEGNDIKKFVNDAQVKLGEDFV